MGGTVKFKGSKVLELLRDKNEVMLVGDEGIYLCIDHDDGRVSLYPEGWRGLDPETMFHKKHDIWGGDDSVEAVNISKEFKDALATPTSELRCTITKDSTVVQVWS